LTAAKVRIIGDKGAYASVGAKVLERAAGHAVGPYRVPNVDIESLAVYTNNPPGGAMRGFGVNQAAFAMERSLDRLARLTGLDGWEIRWRNALDLGDRFCTGQKLDKPFGLKRSLLAVKDAYRAAKYAGIACGVKNVGIGNGMPDEGKAVLRVESADLVTIHTAFTEMGQGHHTICIQTACQETGLPPEVFAAVTDTSVEVNCGQTTASRATVLGGLAVMQAARRLRAALEAAIRTPHASTGPDRNVAMSDTIVGDSPLRTGPGLAAGVLTAALAQLVGQEFRGDYACTDTTALESDAPHVEDDARPTKTHLTYGFATQVATLNDDGSLSKIIAAHDVGRIMNPALLEGQIEGAIHMGLGYALTEELVVEGGRIKSNTVKSLHVLRAHHMPDIEVIFIEEPDPETAYGTRGVGEIGLVPTAPAVAGALEAFDGIHRTRLPMKDSPAAQAILKERKRPT
jgi:CO/xanthine dehydrogenase Mo-binding subunit